MNFLDVLAHLINQEMNENSPSESEQNLEAPAKLIAALKENSRREIFVPPYLDQAVFRAAEKHFEKPAKKRFGTIYRRLLWAALAGACVLCIWMARLFVPHQDLKSVVRTDYAREDLNHDGKVDILDSFALARDLKNGKPSPTVFDVNGDGVVDERDVALIAAHAVELGKGNRS